MEEIAKQLKRIIEDILGAADWESSFFLKQAAAKLRTLLIEADRLCQVFAEYKTIAVRQHDLSRQSQAEILPGFTRVYVLLYQVNGNDLAAWYENIKSLTHYSANRSIYKNQSYAEELMRTKTGNLACHGYVVVDVHNSDFYELGAPALDLYDHELVALKADAIKLEYVVELVLANKQHYIIQDHELVLV